MKRQAAGWEKILAKQDLHPEFIQTSQNSIDWKTNSLIKNGQNT